MTKRQDTGCKLYPSCLNCPLPKCTEDDGGSLRWARNRTRNLEFIERFRKGESISDIAEAFGVSIRTIQRVMKQCREDG